MIRKSGKAPASSEREDDDISLSFPIQNSSNSVHCGTWQVVDKCTKLGRTLFKREQREIRKRFTYRRECFRKSAKNHSRVWYVLLGIVYPTIYRAPPSKQTINCRLTRLELFSISFSKSVSGVRVTCTSLIRPRNELQTEKVLIVIDKSMNTIDLIPIMIIQIDGRLGIINFTLLGCRWAWA